MSDGEGARRVALVRRLLADAAAPEAAPHRHPNTVAVGLGLPHDMAAPKAAGGDWLPVRIELLDTGTTRNLALSLVDGTGQVIRQSEDVTVKVDRIGVEELRDALTAWLERGSL